MAAQNRAWVAATLDTKGAEAEYVCGLLEAAGLPVALADLSTSGHSPNPAAVSAFDRVLISPADIAAHHPQAQSSMVSGDRGAAIAAMTDAFERFVRKRDDIGGMLGLGGSGGTALIAPAMRALPIGVPKVMVSTMASGNVAGYVGASDVTMVYSVTDLAGLNRISRLVLGNAAHALAGMMLHPIRPQTEGRPAVGLTMFGVTTACVQQISERLHVALRLPGVSRHRHRWPVDGKAARGRPYPRGARHHDDRSLGLSLRRRAGVHRRPLRRGGADGCALPRVLRGARHGEFRRAGDGAGTLSRTQVLSA